MQNAELFVEVMRLIQTEEFTSIGIDVRVRPHNSQGYYPVDNYVPCGDIAEFRFTLDYEMQGKRNILSYNISTKDDFAVIAFVQLLYNTAKLSYNAGQKAAMATWRNSIYEDHHS